MAIYKALQQISSGSSGAGLSQSVLPRSAQLPTRTSRHSVQPRGAQNTCRPACCSHTSQSEQCTQISRPSLASRAGVLSLHCAQDQCASSLSQQYQGGPSHKGHTRRLWSSPISVGLTGSRVLQLPVEEARCWSAQPLRTKGASCRQPCAREQVISLLPLSFEGKNKNA